MNLLIDPVSATVASWQLVGKTIEQQLRIGKAVNRALLVSFSLSSATTPEKTDTPPDFLSKRKAKPAAPKAAPRKVSRAAKPVADVEIKKTKPAPAKMIPVAKPAKKAALKPPAVKAAVKPAPKASEVTAPTVVAEKPALKPTDTPTETKPMASATKPSKPASDAPRRRTRAPSKPPSMPTPPKGKLN